LGQNISDIQKSARENILTFLGNKLMTKGERNFVRRGEIEEKVSDQGGCGMSETREAIEKDY